MTAHDGVILATRDAVFASETTELDAWVTGDTGAYWKVLGPARPDTVFAWSRNTGMVCAVTRTGKRETNGQVRVRVTFPKDLGDTTGLLSFNESHTGGVAPARLFA